MRLIEEGDYVKLVLCDDFYKVTKVYPDYIDLVDKFGTPTDAKFEDVEDLKLASEMEYAF